MPECLARFDLLDGLRRAIVDLGLAVREADGLVGEYAAIHATWLLGGRKVSYRISRRLDEADRTVHFREVTAEAAWSLPPPAFAVEPTQVSGWRRSGLRRDHSPGGGGAIDCARVRDKVSPVTAAARWHFHLDGERLP